MNDQNKSGTPFGSEVLSNPEIGRILRYYREKSGFTRETIAEMFGRSAKTVGHWETGHAAIDANVALALCRLYGVNLDVAFGFPDGGSEKFGGLSVEALDLAKDYCRLDGWGRRAVRGLIDTELSRMNHETAELDPLEDERLQYLLRVMKADKSNEQPALTDEGELLADDVAKMEEIWNAMLPEQQALLRSILTRALRRKK